MMGSRIEKFMKKTILSFIAVLVVNTAAFAWGTGGGVSKGDGSGCCVILVPEELEASVIALEKQFELADRKTLLTEQFVGSLCTKHECGDLNVSQAGFLLNQFFAEKDRNTLAQIAAEDKHNSNVFSWANLSVAIISLIIAGFGLWLASNQVVLVRSILGYLPKIGRHIFFFLLPLR